ncbi:MAG: hypothetical protein ABIS84_08450 [Arachnia sp.]
MSDDLSKLTPTTPAAVVPDWDDKRQGILDGILATSASRRSRTWRWVAGVAAAALAVVAVGGLTQQLRDEPYATPASATPTPESTELLAVASLLLGSNNEVGVCLGGVAESRPPQCRTIPITGITWGDVPWAETASGVTWGEATVVGTFDGTTFAATKVFRDDDPEAPQPPGVKTDGDLPTLCESPTRGTGSRSTDALVAMAKTLPGYQALWVSPDQVTFNVAVTEDIEGARSAVASAFGGEFCVGTVDGPTDQALSAAQQALQPLIPGPLMHVPPNDLNDGASVWGTNYTLTPLGNRLSVDVVLESQELLQEVEAAVGPDVWAYTDVIPFFYPVLSAGTPDPTLSSPPTAPAVVHNGPVALEGTLLEVDGEMGLCYGGGMLISEQYPPSAPVCGGGFVPVSGLAMPKDSESFGILVGTFDGTTFHATRLYGPGEENGPRSPLYTMPPEPPDVCEEQTGTGTADENDLMAAANALPGFQGMWLTSDMSASHYRVAVTHGVEEAQKALLDRFGVLLCVATVPGLDAATLRTAEKAVTALWPRGPGQLEPFVGTDVWVESVGTSLRVTVLDDTDDVRSKVEEAVGPEVWPYTKVIPLLFPVEASALEPRVDTPTPMPPGPATPLVITAADRQRAEESVASDLEGAVGTSATAKMTKATFEQYEALWNIDVPYPPGPPPGDTEVLVVTLSASLDNTVMRGGPVGSPANEATGTINVIEAETGKSIIHATLLGAEPQTERITQFPGPIEDVKLPAGFR